MADYNLQIKTNADSAALDDLIAKLQDMRNLEDEAGTTVIRPDSDTTGLDDISGKLDEIESEEETVSSTPLMDIASLTIIADKISDIGGRFEDMSEGLASTTATIDKLSIQSGVSADELKKMTASLSSANFSEDDALAYIKTLDQIGVSSSNLEDSAKGLKNIGTALQLDPSSVRGMANELSVLGVDMNDVTSAYGALGYASANTVGGMENFNRFLTRFDSQFADLGMSVDQSSVAIVAATKKYGGGRAALTGLSNALKNSNGDLSKMEEELGLQPGALTNASEATSAYKDNIDEMASAGAKHLTVTQKTNDAFKDMSLYLSPVIEPLGSVVGGLGKLGGIAFNFNSLKQFYDTLSQSGKIAGMIDTLRGAITAARDAEGIGAGVKAFFSTMLTGEGVAAGTATGPVAGLAIAENSLIWPLLAVAAAVIVVIGVLWYLYNHNKQVKDSVDWLIAAFQKLPGQVIGAAKKVVSGIQAAFSGLQSSVEKAFSGVEHAITAPFTAAYKTVKPIIDTISGAWDWIKGVTGSSGITVGGSSGVILGGASMASTASVNNLGNANNGLISNISNNKGDLNINLSGIIEEPAGAFVVRKLSEEIYKQNILRGGDL